ncbi:MAG TPA: phage tail sheath subtilisin-like domain-containing protein [Streptosporangiaceae bacterium]|nr:phage tail sheath subtilisin-like domain-containing protein [Streptosporangiaceae bacterium]
MTVTPTYPGVYIQEIPSGSRTITGVATSITAFVGTALRGPVNEPVPLAGFGDFERTFGGLGRNIGLGYAVRDFFLNGGSNALVVRVVHKDDGDATTDDHPADTAEISLPAGDGSLALQATGPGVWANALEAEVSYPSGADARDIAAGQGVAESDLFTLVVRDGHGPDAPSETFRNVTVADGPQRLDLVLAASTLVRPGGALPAVRPDAVPSAVGHLAVDGLHLVAHDAATWVPGMSVEVSYPDEADPDTQAEATRQGVDAADLFDLTFTVGGEQQPPLHFLTVVPGPNRVDTELAGSPLAHVLGTLPDARPQEGRYPATGTVAVHAGVDGDVPNAVDYVGEEDAKTGMHALLKADLFNILCFPPPSPSGDLPDSVWAEAAAFCTDKRAFLIVDPPSAQTAVTLPGWVTGDGGLTGATMRNAAIYFPRIRRPDPLRGGATNTFAACGAVAGTYARTDGARGVWTAPAGIDAGLSGVVGLPVSLTDDENGALNPLGLNCLRTFRGVGSVVWGARTLRGSDVLSDDYKYVPVRRLALFLEETLYRSTQWAVFAPNDEPLWAQLRLSVGAFMQSLFRQGAFQGSTPREAFFVSCNRDTTTQYDIDRGIVNLIVGFAPLKPAEFVVISIQQMTAAATA